MAIDSTNTNSVNISNLPKTQIAVDNDLLILQTDNGTQTINFSDFNVVKTDVSGNATVIGDLSGNKSVLNTGLFKNALSAASYYSNNIPGVNKNFGFYNAFTVSNGLITSADYRIGSTEYDTIVNTVIPAVTANQNKVYKYVAYADNETSPIAVPPGFRRAPTDFIISNFFVSNPGLVPTPAVGADNPIKAWHFNLHSNFGSSGNFRLSSYPFVTNLVRNGPDLKLNVDIGYTNPSSSDINFYFSLVYPYVPVN